ncbi:unnamed protein product [Nippostrongylus brasiliensis]|uniref:Secreted protein n=1 Tax=Nippostrongylus brasiliensis TaxID=27835 RepID=A0A0N4YJE5_NIPBR|nr:unnamed protein product [Nippostrongylus brasiliensis]
MVATVTILTLLINFLLIDLTSSSAPDFWTRRHLGNGKLYEFDAVDSPPGDIHRVRIIVVTIMDREVQLDVTGVDERFVLPQRKLSVMCGVTALNERGSTKWTYSRMVPIYSSQDGILESDASEPSPRETPPTSDKPITSEELDTDQLLALIHSSNVEDLPMVRITRPPEERIVVKPRQAENDDNNNVPPPPSTASERVDKPEFDNEDIARDYEILEEDIRRAIGSKKGQQWFKRMQLLDMVDRLL